MGTVMVIAFAANLRGLSRPALAADGAGLVRGQCCVLNEAVVQTANMSDHAGGAMTGGRVFAARLLVGGANVTLAQLLAACPRFEPVYD
jgi:hypothetical protein